MTQQRLGELLGELLDREWPRQTVSAAEKGRRAFTAAEIFALGHVLNTWPAKLLMPANASATVTMPTGVDIPALYVPSSPEAVSPLTEFAESEIRRFISAHGQLVETSLVEIDRLNSLLISLSSFNALASDPEGDEGGESEGEAGGGG